MKEKIQQHLNNYAKDDNLFELLEAITTGLEILESEGFPLRQLSIYNIQEWILQTKSLEK